MCLDLRAGQGVGIEWEWDVDVETVGPDQDLVHVSFCSLSLVRSWFCLTQRVLWEPSFPSMNVNKVIHQDWKSRRGIARALLTFTTQSIWLGCLDWDWCSLMRVCIESFIFMSYMLYQISQIRFCQVLGKWSISTPDSTVFTINVKPKKLACTYSSNRQLSCNLLRFWRYYCSSPQCSCRLSKPQ